MLEEISEKAGHLMVSNPPPINICELPAFLEGDISSLEGLKVVEPSEILQLTNHSTKMRWKVPRDADDP